jgi:ribose transport system ATP-binding protein
VGRDEVTAALDARNISKSFGGTRALDHAYITLAPGEVHCLLGENGSGKSTLIKVLAGYHAPDPGGRLIVGGRPVTLPLPPGRARELGLRFVHQDLGLIPSLSVVENLRLEELAAARRVHISWPSERARARAAFSRLGVDLDPRARVEDLSPVERAQLAIVRAVEDGPRVLVLDEPTAFLPQPQRERLVALLRGIVERGASVLLVTHDLGEAKAIGDRVTILRDGHNVGTVRAAAVEVPELVQMVVGHRLEPLENPRAQPTTDPAEISITGLAGEVVEGVSIHVRRGEVVGLTGLAGSGFEEVPYLVFGARAARAGRLELHGRSQLAAMTPDRALREGMALVPADRQRDGAAGSLSVAANVSLPVLGRYFARGLLDRRRLLADARRLASDHGVRPSEPRIAFDALSGGNQQKALLAKWLQTRPPLLLLDEPTRGVDAAARFEIASTIRRLAREGVSVLCASSDYEQLAELCERVLVFASGRIVRELVGGELTKERIAEQCSLSA